MSLGKIADKQKSIKAKNLKPKPNIKEEKPIEIVERFSLKIKSDTLTKIRALKIEEMIKDPKGAKSMSGIINDILDIHFAKQAPKK